MPGILYPAVTNYWQIRIQSLTPHIESDKLRDQGHFDHTQPNKESQGQFLLTCASIEGIRKVWMVRSSELNFRLFVRSVRLRTRSLSLRTKILKLSPDDAIRSFQTKFGLRTTDFGLRTSDPKSATSDKNSEVEP